MCKKKNQKSQSVRFVGDFGLEPRRLVMVCYLKIFYFSWLRERGGFCKQQKWS